MIIPKVLIGLLLAVIAPPTHGPTSGPVDHTDGKAQIGPMRGKRLVLAEEFNKRLSTRHFTSGRSSAYTLRTMNPADDKLDILSKRALTINRGHGRLTATRSSTTIQRAGTKGYTTALLTTEYSTENFRVRPNDYVETRVLLPTARGAWPGLWTWSGDNTEVDVFEYHPDNPDLLEFINHVVNPSAYTYARGIVRPGKWVTVGALIGASNVTWYVDDTPVWSDHKGVGRNWSAHLILNLSVNAGRLHPRPTTGTFSMSVDWVRVWR